MSSTQSQPRSINSKKRKEAEKAALKLREQYQAKKRQELEAKHRNISEKSAQWNEQILPRWGELCESKLVGDLCMKGIPPSIRGKVWPLLIGNNLKVNFELFQNLVALAELPTTEAEFESRSPNRRPKKQLPVVQESDGVPPESSIAPSVDADADQELSPRTADQAIEREWQQLRRKITNEGLGESRNNSNSKDSIVQVEDSGANISLEMEREWQQLKRKITNEGLRPMYDTFSSQRRPVTDSTQSVISENSEAEQISEGTDEAGPSAIEIKSEKEESETPKMKLRADSDPGSIVPRTPMNSPSPALGNAMATSSSPDHVSETNEGESSTMDSSSDGNSNGPASTPFSSPDPRQKHSVKYLVQAGLVAGTPSATPILDNGSLSPLRTVQSHSAVQGDGDDYEQAVFIDSPRSHSEPEARPLTYDSRAYIEEQDINVPDGQSVTVLQDKFNGVSLVTPEGKIGLAVPKTENSYLNRDRNGSGQQDEFSTDMSMRKRTLGSCTGSNELMRLQLEQIEDEVFPRPDSLTNPSDNPVSRLTDDLRALNFSDTVFEGKSASNKSNDSGLSPTPKLGMKRVTSDGALSSSFSNAASRSMLLAAAGAGGDLALAAESAKKVTIIDDGEGKKSASTSGKQGQGLTPTSPEPTSRRQSIKLIEYDIPRTFPTLAFFHDGGPLHVGLVRVLKAYACYRADVGYVQGMSYIVSMLLLYMDELQAFQSLANLLSRRGNMDFYRLKKFAIDAYVMCFDYFFKQHLPLLYVHMKTEGVTSEMYLMDWNLSLFAKALPLEVAARLWDMYLFEGEVFVTRAALGILRMYAPKLCTLSMEEIMSFLINLPQNVDPDILLANIDQIRISKRKFEEMRDKMTNELHAKYGTTPASASQSERRSSGSSHSTFRNIKRAIRTTFLGPSTSSNAIGSDGHSNVASQMPSRSHNQSTPEFASQGRNSEQGRRPSLSRGEPVAYQKSAHGSESARESRASDAHNSIGGSNNNNNDSSESVDESNNGRREYIGGAVDTYQPRAIQGHSTSTRRNSGSRDPTSPKTANGGSDCIIC